MFGLIKKARRKRIAKRPFPPEWRDIIARNIPAFATLSPIEREELQRHTAVFVAEKRFEGAGGLTLTDEVRVTIAAQACMLLLGRLRISSTMYPRIRSIIVYPSSYIAPSTVNANGLVTETQSRRAGEAWSGPGSGMDGYVVLSWCDVRKGAYDPNDGRNVVYHEFAHILDAENGTTNGSPLLDEKTAYGPWAQVLSQEFQQLRSAARMGMPTLLNKYGTQNPAEFFAVATEAFFEQPHELRARHPELYKQLSGYYHQDPSRRPKGHAPQYPLHCDASTAH